MINAHLLAAVLEADAGQHLDPAYLPAIAAAVGLVGELLRAGTGDRVGEPMGDYAARKIGAALAAAITQVGLVLPEPATAAG